jgi:hypothetical protein
MGLNDHALPLIPKGLKRSSVLQVKINPTYVASFEVRTTSSCNSRLVSADFSCTILDHFLNSIGITSLMLKQCHQDKPFLKATKFQKFQINTNKQLQQEGTSLFITAGDVAEVTYRDAHRWRSLTMQKCTLADSSLSQWHFVKP